MSNKALSSRFFLGAIFILPICLMTFQNCSPASFREETSQNKLVAPGSCKEEELVNLYEMSVTAHAVQVEAYALNCVDSANTFEQVMASSQGYNKTRFLNTCAVRWCSSSAISNVYGSMIGLHRGEAIGTVLNQVATSNTGVLAGQTLQVECRNNFEFIKDEADVCQAVIENKRPVVSYDVAYSADNPCGVSVQATSLFYQSGDPRTCATNFCLGQKDGFKKGLLTEISPSGVRIVCSRAN